MRNTLIHTVHALCVCLNSVGVQTSLRIVSANRFKGDRAPTGWVMKLFANFVIRSSHFKPAHTSRNHAKDSLARFSNRDASKAFVG